MAVLTPAQLQNLVNLGPGPLCRGGPALQPGEGAMTMLGQIALALAYWQAIQTSQPLAVPATPAPTNAGSGGTVLNGVYGVILSYADQFGETLGSVAGTTTAAGTNISTLSCASPPASGAAVGYYTYVTQPNGATYTRQQTNNLPLAIGTGWTTSTPPTSNGPTPQTVNSTGFFGGASYLALNDAVTWLTALQAYYAGAGSASPPAFPGIR